MIPPVGRKFLLPLMLVGCSTNSGTSSDTSTGSISSGTSSAVSTTNSSGTAGSTAGTSGSGTVGSSTGGGFGSANLQGPHGFAATRVVAFDLEYLDGGAGGGAFEILIASGQSGPTCGVNADNYQALELRVAPHDGGHSEHIGTSVIGPGVYGASLVHLLVGQGGVLSMGAKAGSVSFDPDTWTGTFTATFESFPDGGSDSVVGSYNAFYCGVKY